MAIKVNGTTVIDDSRNLVNIASGAGSSTTYGDVGTYIYAARQAGNLSANNTYSGSSFVAGGIQGPTNGQPYITTGSSLSGTWRAMGNAGGYPYSNYYFCTLVVRIS